MRELCSDVINNTPTPFIPERREGTITTQQNSNSSITADCESRLCFTWKHLSHRYHINDNVGQLFLKRWRTNWMTVSGGVMSKYRETQTGSGRSVVKQSIEFSRESSASSLLPLINHSLLVFTPSSGCRVQLTC